MKLENQKDEKKKPKMENGVRFGKNVGEQENTKM